ncbi:hypothetical protein CVIRNUC_007816 [Coccomyxa viridis]|uniref:Uncharacterized protein n=1 Tax=Coccomyxa viridis TaxID=1274662 RepID=A0AAV1ID02_9CHLO|nr:hypothetical protein CVIRNUC_007816 [Coccomyxa viridis]
MSPSTAHHRKHTRRRQGCQQIVALLCWLHAAALGQPAHTADTCVIDPFVPYQAINGSAERCRTCFFPTYPYVDAIDLAAYKPTDFSNQWVYFLGDVTVRQMYGEFAATMHRSQLGQDVGEPLHHSQHSCSSQPERRLGYQPPPDDATPCNLNEKTCTKHFARTSMGSNVTVTYDWKHFMYEDHDRALFDSWQQKGGPHYVVVSPGGHDCYHNPEDYEYHSVEAVRLAKHLHMLPAIVIWVDQNPMSFAVHGKPALHCLLHVNSVAHAQAKELGFFMFSRQTMIMSAEQVDESGHYPMHQPDSVVGQEVQLMLAWLGCMQRHKQR